MLKIYRKNLKYTYNILYPGLKFSLLLLLPVLVILVCLYVIPQHIGVEHAELKLVTTVAITGFLLLSVPFLFITVLSLFKKSQETKIKFFDLVRRLFKLLLPFFFLLTVLIVIVYVIISVILKLVFGIPFFK